MISEFEQAVCNMQGALFRLSAENNWGSETFAETFMMSDIAKELDSDFNYMQWAGKEYIYERIEEELPEAFEKGEVYRKKRLFWMGYIYRYWHYYTGESSEEILKQAPLSLMNDVYREYREMSPEEAIDRLKETVSGSFN